MDLPPPPENDFLTDSTRPRKKRRAIDQRVLLQAEDAAMPGEACEVPRPVLANVDCSFKSYGEFINDWISRWRKLELQHGSEWRSDKKVAVNTANGSVEEVKTNTRSSWWNKRKPLYQFFEVTFGRSDATFEDTIKAGEGIYQRCKTSDKQKKPSMKALGKGFKEELQGTGVIERSGGGRQPSIINPLVTERLQNLQESTSDQMDTAPSFPSNQTHQHGLAYDNGIWDDNESTSSFMQAFPGMPTDDIDLC